jgi:regulator of sigma E protease
MLVTILATIVVLGVLIFVHELGHFMTAKWVDIEVPRFSIGLGPKLWGFRRGETEYVISWLPLGGYVKMAGMEEMEKIEGGPEPKGTGLHPPMDGGLTSTEPSPPSPRDFESKSLPARALVISAGVIMNVLFAFVIFSIIALAWGIPQAHEARLASADAERLPAGTEALAAIPPGTRIVSIGDRRVRDWQDLRQMLAIMPAGPASLNLETGEPVEIQLPSGQTDRSSLLAALRPEIELDPVIGGVAAGQPADRAGLRTGDRIVEAGGQPIGTWEELVRMVEASAGRDLPLRVQRDGRILETTVRPEVQRLGEPGREEEVVRIGVASAIPRDRPGPVGSVVYGVTHTWEWMSLTVGFVIDLFTGDVSPRNLGGPILIGQVSGQVARAGLETFLGFMAIFSINLAILNLLPIPILDGGHLMFLAVEAVRGRALSIEQRMRLSQVGFVIVLAIMVWALANDVLRLFGL